MVGEGGGGGGWGGGGGRIQDVTWLALFVHLSGPLIHKTLWLVKEAVVVVVGGGGVKILWPL